MESKKKKDYRDNFRNASISGGMVETVDRFGSANKEQVQKLILSTNLRMNTNKLDFLLKIKQ